MTTSFFNKRVPLSALILSLGLLSPAAQANEFADDFSSDSIRFTAGSFNDASGIYSITPTSNGLLLSTSALDSSEVGSVLFNIQDSSDSFGMDVTHLSTSTVGDGAFVTSFLETALYSDNPEGSEDNREGTIVAGFTYGHDQSNMPGAFYCLSREDSNGEFIDLPNACAQVEGVNFAIDEQVVLDITLDRDAKQVIFSANDFTRVVDIDGDIFSPAYQFKRIQLFVNGGAADAESVLHTVRLGDETIDMAANPPVYDRYFTNFEPGSDVVLENEKLAISTVSVAEDDRWTDAELNIQQPTEYVEAELTLSSDTDVSGVNYRAFAGIAGSFGSVMLEQSFQWKQEVMDYAEWNSAYSVVMMPKVIPDPVC